MKKALLFAAVALMSTSALASKARRTALGNAPQLTDIQDVPGDVQLGGKMFIAEPDKAAAFGEWATMEFGPAATQTNVPRAEGGFVRMMGAGALGAYIGAPNQTANDYRFALDGAAATTTLKQENPLRVFYAAKSGDINWGAELLYSSSKTTSDAGPITSAKQDTTGLLFSGASDGWDAQFAFGLSNNATTTTAAGDNKLTGKTTAQLSGGYKIDTMYIYAGYGLGGAKGDTPTGTVLDRSDTEIRLGVVNSHKKDGTEFFYGIEYDMATAKDDATSPAAASLGVAGRNKVETTKVPLYVGIEAEAASWLTLRGSVSQTLGLLGLAKTKNSSVNALQGSEITGADSTTVAAGFGAKFNKFNFDAVLASSSTGVFGFDGATLSSSASLTYMF